MNTISPSTSSMTTYIQTYNLCEYLRQNNFDASKAFRAPRLTYIHTYINALRTSGPISGTACYGLEEISLRWPTWKRFKSDLLLTQCSGSHAWALFNVCTQFIQQTKGTLGVAGTIRTIAAQAPHDDRSCGTWTIVACSCDFLFLAWVGCGACNYSSTSRTDHTYTIGLAYLNDQCFRHKCWPAHYATLVWFVVNSTQCV